MEAPAFHFTPEGDGPTTVTGNLPDRGLFGFLGRAPVDTSNGFMSTGPHFNPVGKEHDAPGDENCYADYLGTDTINIVGELITLTGPHSVIGREVVVHADPDDLERGGHELSESTGNAGGRVAWGTTIDQGIACGLMLLALVLTYFIHTSDAPSNI
ncbi:unnamed protein product [Fraxinus pennsylvanica]|uniref:Superoxide dismutase copper/zinc binding domain-containing protein n=1 Tax=Fraxinus pennsylvanica TaxID=56036 RepID=A0AAD1ZXD9_9LAMI|nr:unnamed protein product [Fraxinus pennsylvanica]